MAAFRQNEPGSRRAACRDKLASDRMALFCQNATVRQGQLASFCQTEPGWPLSDRAARGNMASFCQKRGQPVHGEPYPCEADERGARPRFDLIDASNSLIANFLRERARRS